MKLTLAPMTIPGRLCAPELVFTGPNLYQVIGQNGSGKTTLLLALSGILGEHCGWSGVKKRIFLPHQFSTSFEFRVEEILALSGDGEVTLAADLDDYLQVNSLLQQYFHQLSAGQQQRVLIARVLRPYWRALQGHDVGPSKSDGFDSGYLLVFDEPFQHLDLAFKSAVMTLFERLAQHHLVVIAHHALDVLGRTDSMIVGIKQHQVMCMGDTASLLTPDRLSTLFDTTVIEWQQLPKQADQYGQPIRGFAVR